MSLSKCMQIVDKMDPRDVDQLFENLDKYEALGVPRERAQKLAAMELLMGVEVELAAEQNQDLPEKTRRQHNAMELLIRAEIELADLTRLEAQNRLNLDGAAIENNNQTHPEDASKPVADTSGQGAAGGSSAAKAGSTPVSQDVAGGPGHPAGITATYGHRDVEDARSLDALEAKLRQVNDISPNHPGIKADSSSPGTRALEALLGAFEKITGIRGQPIHWTGGPYGVQYGKSFFVNTWKPDMHVGWTIGHEFSHLAEQYPGLNKLRDALWRQVDQSGRSEYFEYLKRSGQVQSDSVGAATGAELKKLKDEMLADFMGKRFTDKAWLKRLARQEPSLFGEFVRDWLKLLGDLISSLKGSAKALTGPKNVDRYITQLEEAKSIAAEMAIEWAKRHPDAAGADTISQSATSPQEAEALLAATAPWEIHFTWLADPDASTGLLGGMRSELDSQERRDFLIAMRNTLEYGSQPSVQDLLGWKKRFSNSVAGAALKGLTGWAMHASLHLPNGVLDERTRNEITFYLATHGIWTGQASMSWHLPVFGRRGTGVEFNLGRKKITDKQFEEVTAAVQHEFRNNSVQPISSKNGLRFLNTIGMGQEEFIGKVKDAISHTSVASIWSKAYDDNISARAGQNQGQDGRGNSGLRAGSPDLQGQRGGDDVGAFRDGIRIFSHEGGTISNDWTLGEGQFRQQIVDSWKALKDLPGNRLPKTLEALNQYMDAQQANVDGVNHRFNTTGKLGKATLTQAERAHGVKASFEFPARTQAASDRAKGAFFKNPDGTLAVLYHGGADDIIDLDQRDGISFFASTLPAYANEAARIASEFGEDDATPTVYPVHVLANKPFDWRIEAHRDNIEMASYPKGVTAKSFPKALKDGDFDLLESKPFADAAKAAGYDSVLVRDDKAFSGFLNIGVFDPDDVVFAISHNGQKLDPPKFSARDSGNPAKTRIVGRTTRQYTDAQRKAFANVGFEVEVPSLKERAQALWKDAGKKLAQGLVDQFAPIKAISQEAYGLLRLAKGSAGSFETLLKGGMLKLTDGVYDFDEARKGGVIDKLLIPMQGEHHDFMRWVAANRAERLMGEGKERLFTPEDIAAIKTLANGNLDFDYTIKTGPMSGLTTRDREQMYRDSRRVFNAFNNNVLDMAQQSGLIDAEARQLFDSEFYVPFYRVTDDGVLSGASIKGGVIRKQAFKELKGGTNALSPDLLDNTLMNWSHLLDAAAKNRAAKAALEAAEAVGVAVGTDEATARQMGQSIGNSSGVVWFMDEGVKHHYLVDDPYVLTAISSLQYAGMRSPLMTALSTAKHVLTVGVTASPFFKIRNLIRDSVQVIGTGPISYNPAKNLADGWKLTNPENDIYFRLLAGGGTIHFGTMLEGSEAKRVQALVESGVDASTILGDEHKVKAFYRKYIEPGITAYNELGNRGEAINRAALYDQLIKQGLSHADASLQARDLMDFSMQGSFTTIRLLTQVVPFLNARMQGMYKLGRAAKEDPRRLAYVTGAVALASLALLAAYGDDDDWKKREDWDRNNFWWFKFGGTAFRVPKPFEIGAIGTLAERSAELMFDTEMTGKRFRAQVLTLLGENLGMNPVPQLVKPMIDVYANKDAFTGRPIETMGMERMKSEYRFNGGTSMTARAVSTALNEVTGLVDKEALSPVQVDALIRGYFGWLGTFAVATADIAARDLTNQPTRPSIDLWKAASGGMIRDLTSEPSRYVSQVYEQAREIEQAYSTWRDLMRSGRREEAAEYRADNAALINSYGRVQQIKGAITKINQRIKVVEKSNMSPDQKRTELTRLHALRDTFARRLKVPAK